MTSSALPVAEALANGAPGPDVAERFVLRPISAEDKPALMRFHDTLSAETRYRRFHAAKGGLTAAELRFLCEVDQREHIAVVACPNGAREQIIGVARSIGFAPGEAEIAIVVTDAHHGHGVGRALMSEVIERTRRQGRSRLLASVAAVNVAALKLFERFGFRSAGRVDLDLELRAELDPPAPMTREALMQ